MNMCSEQILFGKRLSFMHRFFATAIDTCKTVAVSMPLNYLTVRNIGFQGQVYSNGNLPKKHIFIISFNIL